MYRWLRPLLFLLPPEAAHRLGMRALAMASHFPPALSVLRLLCTPPASPRLEVRAFGLTFPSPIGLAAGLDKDGEAVPALEALGFGFVEVGTVTPRPQPGNPRPRLFRLPLDRALINRMGFNNHGAEAMAARLARTHRRPLGINLGKNKDTPLEQAPADYLASLRALYDRGDYFVVNVSSPNTPGLRSLQAVEALEAIVKPLLAERASRPQRKPLLVKLAPDLALEEALSVAQACESWGLDGLIVSNTTLSREGLQTPEPLRSESGGLSGAPLLHRSTELLRALAKATRLPLIGVGGVFTPEEAYAKLRAGATLVQVYTGFIYGGPALAGELSHGLERLLARDGLTHVSQAVGADLKPAA
jgi:dihydroorotate dehydrogenase